MAGTAYQNNLYQASGKKKNYTSRDMYGYIAEISEYDPEEAQRLYKKLQVSQQDVTSKYYNPYTQATNQAVGNMSALGFDVSNINDDWFNKNSWLKQYYQYTDNTNGLSSTMNGKKGTPESRAAYQYNQIWMAEENTKKAEQEWQALQQELTYWAKDKNRNYSDDEIISRIDWSKYKTLQKMDDTRKQGTPMELNRAIGYSNDAIYGVLWAARNNGGTGDLFGDIAYSALGKGKQWEENPEITAKLNKKNLDTYSPYSVGMTLEEEGLYFGVSEFNDRTIEKIRKNLDFNDETAVKMFDNVLKAEEKTKKLETQLNDMNALIDDLVHHGWDAETILSEIEESSDFSDLLGLDKTLESTLLEDTTRAIDYRWVDVQKKVREACQKRDAEEGTLTSTENLVNKPQNPYHNVQSQGEKDYLDSKISGNGGGQYAPATSPNTAQSKMEEDNTRNLNYTAPAVTNNGTNEEKIVYDTGRTSFFDRARDMISNAQYEMSESARMSGESLNDSTGATYIDTLHTIKDYENEQQALANDQKTRETVQQEYDKLRSRYENSGNATWWDADRIEELTAMPGWERAKEQIQSSDPGDQYNGYGFLFNALQQGDLGGFFDEELERIGWNGDTTSWINLPDDVREKLQKRLDEVADIAINGLGDVNEYVQPLSEEEEDYMYRYEEELDELDDSIARHEAYISDKEADYKAAMADRSNLYNQYDITAQQCSKAGVDFDSSMPEIMEIAYNAGQQYAPPQFTLDSAWKLAVQNGDKTAEEAVKEAQDYITKYTSGIDKMRKGLEADDKYHFLSAEERRNVESNIAELEKQITSAGYFLMDQAEDFDNTAIHAMTKGYTDDMSDLTKLNIDFLYGGRDWNKLVKDMSGNLLDYKKTMDAYDGQFFSKEGNLILDEFVRAGIKNRMSDFITQDERKRYFYLLSTEGEDAANEYFKFLVNDTYGYLFNRTQENFKDTMTAMTEGGGALGVLGQIASYGFNLVGIAQSTIAGDDRLGYMATVAKNALREGTSNRIEKTFGENAEVVNFFMNAANSAVDSYLTGAVTNGLFTLGGEFLSYGSPWIEKTLDLFAKAKEGGGVLGLTTSALDDWLHAVPMALGAASEEYYNLTSNGVDPDKARQMATVTFLSESVTEALTYGNLSKMWQGGESAAISGVLTELLGGQIEEVFGESAGQYFEGELEKVILGKMSTYGETYAYYHDQLHLPKSIAEEMATKALTKEVVEAGLSAFFSSGMGQVAAYTQGSRQNRQNNNAQQAITSRDLYFLNGLNGKGNSTTNNANAASGVAGILKTGLQMTATSTLEMENAGDAASAAGQHMVNQFGQNTAKSTLRGLLSVAGNQASAIKNALTFASLTDGNANQTLSDIANKAANGEQITGQDAINLLEAVEEDQSGDNADALKDQYNKTIRDNREAQRVRDKLSNPDTAHRLKEAETKVVSTRKTRDQASEKAEQAQNSFDTAKQGATDSMSEVENDANNKQNVGPVQQDLGHLDAADELAIQRQEELAVQEEKVRQAEEESKRVQQEELTKAREEASVEVEQEVQQQQANEEQMAQQRYDESVQSNPPSQAFGRSIDFKDDNGNDVKITGVYDQTDTGWVFTTEDGRLVTINRDIGDVNIPGFWETLNKFEDKGESPQNKPLAYMSHSITGRLRSGGGDVKLIGVVGVQNYNGQLQPVFMGEDGNTYTLGDVRLNDSLDVDDIDVAFDAMTPDMPVIDTVNNSKNSNIQAMRSNRSGQNTTQDETTREYDRKLSELSKKAALSRLSYYFQQGGMSQEQADAYANEAWNYYQRRTNGKVDLTKSLTEGEGKRLINKMAKSLGLRVEYADMAKGFNGKYENGVVTLSNSLTTGQAMVEIALHEITHALEATGTYNDYSRIVQDYLFADEASKEQAIQDKIKEYKDLGVELTPEQAMREIVADFAKDNFADPDVIKRLVDKGLGGRLRSILHDIVEWFQNRNMPEEQKAQVEKFKEAERLLKQAMEERTRMELDQYTPEQKQQSKQMVQDALDNPKSQFSLTSPIEVREDGLVAMHNLEFDTLRKVLKMAGFPMASIAVTRAGNNYFAHGPISFFFGREDVDPSLGKVLYNGDANTPTLKGFTGTTAEEALEFIKGKPERTFRANWMTGGRAVSLKDYLYGFMRLQSIDDARRNAYAFENHSAANRGDVETMAVRNNNFVSNYLKSHGISNEENVMSMFNRGVLYAYESLQTKNADNHMSREEIAKYYEDTIDSQLRAVGVKKSCEIASDPKSLGNILSTIDFFLKHYYSAEQEAKTPEILRGDRVTCALLPSNTPEDLVQGLIDFGVPQERIRFYEAGNAVDRWNQMKSIPKTVPGVAFSIGNTTELSQTELEDALRATGLSSEETTPRIQGLKGTKAQTPTQKQAQETNAKYSPARIANTLANALGVGNNIGTRRAWNTRNYGRAFFDRHSNSVVVKSKDAGNYMVTIHELGHAIANMFDLSPTQEMMDNFRQIDPSFFNGRGYKAEELPGEAIAEFMWRYMEGEEQGRAFAGDAFYDAFEAVIRGTEAGNAIAEARQQMQMWLNAPVNQKIQSTIVNRSDKANIPLRQRIREAIDALIDSTSAAADFDAVIREMNGGKLGVMDSVRNMALWANTAGKQATSILMGSGLTDAYGNVIGDSLADRLASVGFRAVGDNLDLLNQYMLALHSLYRDRQGKPVFDNHITREERVAFIKDIQQNHPEIAAAEEQFQAFRREFMEEFLVKTGQLSQEAFDAMEEMYPHYVPTFRVKRSGVQGQPIRNAKTFQIKSAKGSTEDIYNPFDSFCGMVNTIVSQNALNRAALTFDQMYQTHEGLGAFAEQMPAEPNTKAIAENEVKQIIGDQLDADTMEQLMEFLGKNISNRSANEGDILKVVRPDGTVVSYQFNNMELFKLLSGINLRNSNAAINAVGIATRYMSALTTGSNPIFAARNFMRDFQNSVNYGSWASNYGTGVMKWLAAAYDVWRESDNYKDYVALGGGGWTRIDPSRQATRNELYSGIFEGYETANVGRTLKWAGKKVWNAVTLARLNEIIEQTSRFAEYKYGKHNLNTEEGRTEAYLAAQEATVDFNRSGNSGLAVMLKKFVPFFNASAQGVYRTTRMLTEEERSRAPQRFAKTVINTAFLSAICTALLKANMDDDDKKEFEMLSDDLKAKHFYLPNFAPDILGEAPLIRIPLAQDPLTYAVHGAVTNALWSGDTEDGMMIDLGATAETILDNMNPLGSTILAPILGINANKTWYGSSIVPSYLQRNKYEPDQYTEETPEIFRQAGRVFGISPMKVQYLAEQYTGFLGQLAIPALSPDSKGELGGIKAAINAARKRFVSDPLTSNDVISSFYDGADILNSVIEETNQGKPLNILRRGLTQEEAGRAYEEAKEITNGAIADAKKKINALYTEIDQINESNLSDHDKYLLTSEKRREMIEIALDANEQIGAYKEKYVQGSNLVMQMLTQGTPSYKPTEQDKMSDTFKADMDDEYMKRAMSVYENESSSGYGKEAALPHPSRTFTSDKVEYEISDDEWNKYEEVYKKEYKLYMDSKGRRWDTMTDDEQYDLLKAAHRSANDKMKKQYLKDHPKH